MTIVQETLFSWVWLLVPLSFLVTGCPATSDWEQQWQLVQITIKAGRLHDAKKLLTDILPSVRDKDPTDERYGQVIFQLGEIARLEGNTSEAESFYWKALPLIANSLGPEHVRMAEPLTKLASLYEHKDQPQVALPLLKRALALQEKTWGTSNRQLLPSLKHYHLLLMLSDRHDEAIEVLSRISHLEQTPS